MKGIAAYLRLVGFNSALVLMLASKLHAANFIVTTNADSGPGSLRQALADAASLPGADRVTFAPELAGQTISLIREGPNIFINDTGEVTVDATSLPGGLVINGGTNRSYGLIEIASGSSVTLLGLTFADSGATTGPGFGGALLNGGGVLTLSNCVFSGNTSEWGGAINSSGTLTMMHCTLSSNYARGFGGALQCSGTTLLTYCTFTGNSAVRGGAIRGGEAATLTHCTLSGNVARGGNGGAILLDNAANETSGLTLNYTIAAGNSPNNVYVFYGGFAGTNSITDGNPLLAPLGDYGGSTKTMALLPGSPARNAALGSTASSDQRGFPIVGVPDIGAYESGTLDSNFNAFIWESLPTTNMADHAAGFDYDSDGASNTNEWLALTDPASAASVLRAAITRAGTNIFITFPSVTNRIYTLFQSDALPGSWINSGLSSLPGNGETRAFTNTTSTNAPGRFFQIQAGP